MKKAIEVANLSFVYPDEQVALKDITFEVEENETVFILGANGSGKTTLLLSLCGLLKFQGEIKIFGERLISKNSSNLRKKLGLLFQDPDDQLFTPTVFDDVAFGPLNLGYSKEIITQKVKESLKKVGMEEFENRNSHRLSFGEKKKISLATVLSMSPEILLLDEPTSNLDPLSRRRLIELIKNMYSTKIIATFDVEMALELADRVIVISKGKKVAEGKKEELLSNRKIMEETDLEVPISLVF